MILAGHDDRMRCVKCVEAEPDLFCGQVACSVNADGSVDQVRFTCARCVEADCTRLVDSIRSKGMTVEEYAETVLGIEFVSAISELCDGVGDDH